MQEHDKILKQVRRNLAQEGQAGHTLPPAAVRLLDNYSLLLSQTRELHEALSPKFWRKLTKDGQTSPRICVLAKEIVDQHRGRIGLAELKPILQQYQETAILSIAELWAIRPIVKLALLDKVVALSSQLDSPEAEEFIPNAIGSLRTIDQGRYNDFIESISAVESILREDPSGTYPNMDFDTRDSYRRAVEEISERSWHDEPEVARVALGLARNASTGDEDTRKAHVGYYLAGPGRSDLRVITGHASTLSEALRDLMLRYPNLFYIGSTLLLTLLLLRGAAAFLSPAPWWILALLLVPLSQVALSILNPLVNRAIRPRRLPRLDFSRGIPDDCRGFLVVPTLLLSKQNVENLLERIEIHYLANRDSNLLFGLLTDLSDAPSEHNDKDELVELCAKGIRDLNQRYSASGRAPFYLFNRPRLWNASENAWMGYERKRGKLEDFNNYLLHLHDAFDVKAGDLEAIHDIRYVITLDTDTHLPRDAARELIGTMAHPLNEPIFNKDGIVGEGYALLQPRVSISMESARRSRMAAIYSGQTGLDPYTKAISDIYQDLHGQASYTGKGVYDLVAFDRATRNRFPENTLLSHDLIEGEHARVGLVTDVEVVDDFPTTYEAFCKRKHRWARGDWQIAEWLLPRVPNGTAKRVPNSLSILSRWKIFDNLRRSVYEISLVLFFLCGMFATGRALRYSLAVIAVLVVPAFAQMFFSLLSFPPRRFLRSFLREVGWNFMQGILEAALTITFLLHQALLMTDAIVRTLVRRYATKRNLLEWESMAQAEAGGGGKLSLVTLYLLSCPAIATGISFFAARAQTGYELLPIWVLLLWAATPLAAEFVSRRVWFQPGRDAKDTRFLRELSLQTWHYFVDFGKEDENWLVPDNVQFEPYAVATRTSPTNIGLQLVANIAARDFGYLTQSELAARLFHAFTALDRLERDRGHFYNWYDTRTLQPLQPRYISAVDSGNLAASLITVKQACIEILQAPLISVNALEGLRDHCRQLKSSVPHSSRTAPVMQKIVSVGRQLDYAPTDLFSWAGQLDELQKMAAPLTDNVQWLCEHAQLKKGESCGETRYWLAAFNQRVQAWTDFLTQFAPWATGPLGKEVRMSSSDPRLASLMKILSRIPKLESLPEYYDSINHEIRNVLLAGELMPLARRTLEDLGGMLNASRRAADELCQGFERVAGFAHQLAEEMDFRFLLDRGTNLMHIGFDVDAGKLDDSHYDLLASEARTAVFIGVAKGDLPCESWFRLGRKLTTYQGYRALLSWSGTMFEYLMPCLFLRNFEDSLLGASVAGAVRIQQLYCRAKGYPWGISEAAYNVRDASSNYQYRAFGVPVLGLAKISPEDYVVAPYASALALMVDPRGSTANLRQLAERGWSGRYGFYESIDYTGRKPVLVRAYMVHHQGMALLALANSLLNNVIQRRFHAEPMVLATQLLLQERLPALVAENEVEEHLKFEPERPRTMVEVGQES
jgi:hypothetical protein